MVQVQSQIPRRIKMETSQQLLLMGKCQKMISKLQQYISKISNIQLNNVSITKLLMLCLINSHVVSRDQIVVILRQNMLNTYLSNLQYKYIISGVNKRTVIQQMINNQSRRLQDIIDTSQYQQYYHISQYVFQTTKLNLETIFLRQILEFEYQKYKISYLASCNTTHAINRQKISQFLCQFYQFVRNKKMDQLNEIGYINVDRINSFYNKHNKQQTNNQSIQLYLNIYKNYIETNYPVRFVYDVYHVLHKLIRMKQQEFDQKFALINSKVRVSALAESIKKNQVTTMDGLKSRAFVSTLLENSHIDIIYGEDCYFDDIDDDTFDQLFYNIDKKLQWVSSNQCFIVIKKLSDGKLYKRQICNNNTDYESVEEFLLHFLDGNVYDVILKGFPYQNLQKINIRFLSYIGREQPKISFKYPETIVSLSLQWVEITNLHECVNLVNLFTQWNHYNYDNIKPLQNIRRFYSISDTYESESTCMVGDLLKQNKLEYIYVSHARTGKNIIRDLKMIQNIENMRFFYHLGQQKTNVTIDVSNGIPDLLQVMFMSQQIDNQLIHVPIDVIGDKEKLKKQLFHENINN